MMRSFFVAVILLLSVNSMEASCQWSTYWCDYWAGIYGAICSNTGGLSGGCPCGYQYDCNLVDPSGGNQQ